MINNRESEIRDKSLALTVVAYDLASSLTQLVTINLKNQILDECFNISSGIAEAFRTNQNDVSVNTLENCLYRLISLKTLTSTDNSIRQAKTNLHRHFIEVATTLEEELEHLLEMMKRLNADEYEPKLELACI